MKRLFWGLCVPALIAVVLIGWVHLAGRRAAENRLATYRYVVAPDTSPAAMRPSYAERPALDPQVVFPRALTVNRANRIIVAGASNLTVLTRDGIVLHDVPLDEPAWCLAADDANRIYVGHARTISVLDGAGQIEATWTSLGENARLTSLAVYGGEVFAADAGQRTVWRMDLEGRLLSQIAGRGFTIPSPYFDVVVDEEGPWIVNPGRLRVEHYTRDGAFERAWGAAGMGVNGFCGCCNPVHLARLPSGNFVTAEKGLARIKVVDPEGTTVAVVADRYAFAAGDLACNEAAHIADLAVDAEGRVLALDRTTGKVRVFVRAGDEAATTQ